MLDKIAWSPFGDRQPGGPSSIAAPWAWHPVGMPFPAALPAEIDADPWRLRLLSDADWMLAWTMSRDPDVVRWTLYPPEMTKEAAHRRSRRITESANQRLSGHYAVVDADSAAIGTAGIASSEGDFNDAGTTGPAAGGRSPCRWTRMPASGGS